MTDTRQNGDANTGAGRAAGRWHFGNAVLDERSFRLYVGGKPVELERKPLEVLLHLLRHAGELASKDDLLAAVWPGRILTETVLTKCVHKLRDALGDEGQTVIATVHGVGYRLDVPVQSEEAGSASQAPAPASASGEAAAAVGIAAPAGAGPRVRLMAAGFAIAGLAVVVALFLYRSNTAPLPDASVAVLPFANLSEDAAASDYFVNGVHDAVITHLARVQDLKIISRTSVMEYGGQQRNLKQIGRELGVANIVEGSVQRSGDRVRVTAQLIRVADDRHVWTETYDRDISDVFAIQSDVAQQVAAGVKTSLTDEERARIRDAPSTDPKAYELYLLALERERGAPPTPENVFAIQSLLEEAIARDPDFALAHAALGLNHMRQVWWKYDTSPEPLDAGRSAIDAALKLDPGLSEAHHAKGMYYYWGFRDYARATGEFDIALQTQPNAEPVLSAKAYVQRRLGRWDEALANLSRARELDPRNLRLIVDFIDTYEGLRNYAEADRHYRLARDIAPDMLALRLAHAELHVMWKGDVTPLREALEAIPAGVDPDYMVTGYRATLAIYENRLDDALRHAEAFRKAWIPSSGGLDPRPKAFLLARLEEWRGNPAAARPHYLTAIALLEDELRRRPEAAGLRADLALALAGVNRKDAALKEADAALQLLPISRDAMVGPEIAERVAKVYLRVGQMERGLDLLESLLSVPAGVRAHTVRLDPSYRPLRDHPRFQKMIAEHLPKT